MTQTLNGYFAALERLKHHKAKINNDTVAIEAGRKKGSIKKSRPQFAELIDAIAQANREANSVRNEVAERLVRAKAVRNSLQHQLDAAISRELSLLKEVFDLRKELVRLRGGNVIPIREEQKDHRTIPSTQS